ncbi:MAG: hypothetical protein GWO07_15285 [Candidatus Dadabacteria bacterium]|nr:hypothetical protein [Candidatus Dadabacteria bacterium]NIS10076.1 hypothetical protein [Candidatus Dadabacteria bacterium]NIV42153.1 hypothetical protein [Candidatus Dadabacteria bacterium]NIX16462.1 hypothetical protein [Candidatus Dadabacteria bacterium]NIY23023.1 hypothetical protein [Candidatus Dadabacteria bacterium]
MPIYTDAPSDWPKLDISLHVGNNHMNAVNIAKELSVDFKENKKDYIVSSFLESLLLENGVLQSHITISHPEGKYYVFIFHTDRELSSRFYAGIKYLFSNSKSTRCVYFAGFDLDPDAKPALPLREFAADLFSKLGKGIPENTYSIWSSMGEDTKFTDTEDYELIDELVDLTDGIHSYLLAEILRSIKEIEQDVGRIELPDEEFSTVVVGPENQVVILSASKKRGIMLHFNEEQVTNRYRILFLKHFNSYVKGLRNYIAEKNIELDTYSGDSPKKWWIELNNEIKEKESKGEVIQRVGVF